jgi:hypothetical protein
MTFSKGVFMTNTNNIEKRSETRIKLEGKIKITLDDKNNYDAELINITSKSIAFLIKEKLVLNAVRFLKLVLPNEKNCISNIKCKIARQAKVEDAYFTVLMFVNIPENSRTSILNYLKNKK